METEKQIFVITALIKLLSLTGRLTPSLHSIEVILMMTDELLCIEVCFVIGVILHHLWLTVFYFMSVATLCIVMNLTKLRSNVQTSHIMLKDRKRCLALGGAIVPCMFVGPAVLLDIYGDAYLSSIKLAGNM
jgi:hypothetical protein